MVKSQKLVNPQSFVQEAHQVGIYYHELKEAQECINKQKTAEMFLGKSKRGEDEHITSSTVDKWIATFEYAQANPDEPDSDRNTSRGIKPKRDWYEYLKVIRRPIPDREIESWERMSNKALGEAAIRMGITHGIANTKALKTLHDRMLQAVERRREHIWREEEVSDTEEKYESEEDEVNDMVDGKEVDTESKEDLHEIATESASYYSNVYTNNPPVNYHTMNTRQIDDECLKRGIVIGRHKKAEKIRLIEEYDANPPDSIVPNTYEEMSRNELMALCKERGFISYNNLAKKSIVRILKEDDAKVTIHVNAETGERVESKEMEVALIIKDFDLILPNGNIEVVSGRTDGYINATFLCKAGNRRFYDWSRLESTKILVDVMQSQRLDMELIDSKQGGKYPGTWIHPDLAIHLAMWISPLFASQVSRWINELLTTGSVHLERPVRTITDMSQVDIQAEIIESKREKICLTNTTVLYVVYIGVGLVKVGYSDCRVTKRFEKHASSDSDYPQFRVLATFEISSRKVEKEIHEILLPYQVTYKKQKEIYRPEGDLMEFIYYIEHLLQENDTKLLADKYRMEIMELRLELSQKDLRIMKLEQENAKLKEKN